MLPLLDEVFQGGECPGAQATRVAFRHCHALRFAELFLVPVIGTTRELPLGDAQRWKWAEEPIANALGGWLGADARTAVFSRLYPYEWISSWPAAALRAHVLSTVPGVTPTRLTFPTQARDLPQEAPRLVFICVVVTATRGWPELPARGEDRFRRIAALALQGPREPAPIVLSPSAPATAILDGLILWLQELDRAAPIKGWTVKVPGPASDVIKVTLEFRRPKGRLMQFVVRRNQIGEDGVRHLLATLHEIAPILEESSHALWN